MNQLKLAFGTLTLVLATAFCTADPTELVSIGEGKMHPQIDFADTSIVQVKEDSIIFTSSGSEEWPNITFRPTAEPWDLSGYYTVKAELTNLSSKPVLLGVRLDNPYKKKEDAPQHAQGYGIYDPGETRTMTLRLYAEPWRFKEPLGLVGMRRNPGESTMNLDIIDRVSVFAGHVQAPVLVEVSDIRAEGSVKVVDGSNYLPFVDAFGQNKHKNWEGKIRSDADLKKVYQEEKEQWRRDPGVPGLGKFGGWKDGPQLKATGFFRLEKYQGKWYFVDPEGYLFWSNGPTCISASFGYTGVEGRENYFEGLPDPNGPLGQFYSESDWAPHGFYKDKIPFQMYRFFEANLFRKYGSDWQVKFYDSVHHRLKTWGMNTIANWADRELCLQRRTPYTANFWVRGNRQLEASQGYWGKFHDVFDPSFREVVRRELKRLKKETQDPWCIGFFVDNELSWGYDGMSLALETLSCPADQPAKRVFVKDLKTKYATIEKLNAVWDTEHANWQALLDSTETPDIERARGDLEKFYAKTADTYFKMIHDELEKAAPNHLYLGCRFAWVNDAVAHASALYCDVVSYNKYQYSIRSLHLPHHIDRPIIIGEYHFGATDRGHFHPGLKEGVDQNERAALLQDYLRSALDNPQVVGVHWFQWVDSHIAGRADEENYNVGLVDVTDTPYPELTEAFRQIGNVLYDYRLNGR
ncbi:MAG: beta-agarase [Lentimonas sp.]